MWKKLTTAGREERLLELLLRIGVAGCFIGHGAFGVIGKEAWLPYFAVAGIPESWAWTLMPIVGSIDIAVGVLALLAPRPVLLGYAAFWAMWTALLRPLAGESVFETLERAGNYGVPVAFLLLVGVGFKPTTEWLKTVEIRPMTTERRNQVATALRATVAVLLAGHGGLAFLGKPLLGVHAAAVGLPEGMLAFVGAFEIALAGAIALRPTAGLLLFVLAWKVGTEALYPVTGAPFWEFVERAGSYIAPLALWTMVRSEQGAEASASSRLARTTSVGVLLAVGVFAAMAATPGERAPISSAYGTAPRSAAKAAVPDGIAHAGPSARAGAPALLDELRQGGFVFACRHAITDRSRGDARRVDLDDPSTQRVLSDEGRVQARRLGDAIRRLEIPIGEVLTSAYSRTRETVELAFGRGDDSNALIYGNRREQQRGRRRLLREAPTDGTNRVLMTHQGILYGNLDVPRGSIPEGNCVVVEPSGDEGTVVRNLAPEDWETLR